MAAEIRLPYQIFFRYSFNFVFPVELLRSIVMERHHRHKLLPSYNMEEQYNIYEFAPLSPTITTDAAITMFFDG